jgi:hypothetical protein
VGGGPGPRERGEFGVAEAARRDESGGHAQEPVESVSGRVAGKDRLARARPGLEVKLVATPEGAEQFILCRSRERAAKVRAMLVWQLERLKTELHKIFCLVPPITGRWFGLRMRSASSTRLS